MPQTAGYADANMMESRKRGHDSLEAFFLEAKRRQFDASQYIDLGARFGGIAGLSMGLGGFGAQYGFNNVDYASNPQYQQQQQQQQQQQAPAPPPPQQPYMPSFESIKTKNDLMSIDQFLEQLQNTVYEHPGRTMPEQVHAGLDPRLNGSPPQMGHGGLAAGSVSHASNTPSLVEDTPTPSSIGQSHSPASVNSHYNASPRSSSNMYPTLPTGAAAPHDGHGGFGAGGSVPHAGLANQYEGVENRHHYYGGSLQRARQSPTQTHAEPRREEGSATPKDKKEEVDAKPAVPAIQLPSDRPESEGRGEEPSSEPRSASPSNQGDPQNEAWVENMKVIEAIRAYIRERLEREEFEKEGESERPDEEMRDADADEGLATPRAGTPIKREADEPKRELSEREKEAGSLYPILRAVESGN